MNLNAPDGGLAKTFYVDGLGCGVHPTRDGARSAQSNPDGLLHANLGLSQFHVPTVQDNVKKAPVDTAQVWSGTLELLTSEPLADVAARLDQCLEALRDSTADATLELAAARGASAPD